MNWKLIAYSLGLILIGGAIGYFAGPKVDGTEKVVNEALKSIDSINIVNIEKEKAYQDILKITTQRIAKRENNLKKRDEDFKNDTTTYTNDELIQRIRARASNN